MKKSSSYKRHRNPPSKDEQAQEKPFFSKGADKDNSSTFFTANTKPVQAKLTLGQPGDQYEKEADSVADKVVNKSAEAPQIQQQQISTIQRSTLMSSVEDEKLGTAEARMEKDKMIQEKPIQKMDQEEEAPVAQAKEEEESITTQAKEEDEPLQEKEMEEDMQQKEEEELQAKSKVAAAPSKGLGTQLKSAKGKGKPLHAKTKHEMESAIGADFDGVNIHTDTQSVEMNQALKAQAFTNGKDIYFNTGKYRPETAEGKRLLAHELTHVVQQGEAKPKTSYIQKQSADSNPDSYLKGDNHWFESKGAAFNAANLKLSELSLQGDPVYRIEHHPLPTRGLPHYHVYHISKSKLNYNGHFFYKTKRRRRQYKVDWRTVYKVVTALGLSLALIAVILAALVDPEPVTKLALAGLSMAMIGLILSKLDAKSDTNNEA